jgi:hypothetical protein
MFDNLQRSLIILAADKQSGGYTAWIDCVLAPEAALIAGMLVSMMRATKRDDPDRFLFLALASPELPVAHVGIGNVRAFGRGVIAAHDAGERADEIFVRAALDLLAFEVCHAASA